MYLRLTKGKRQQMPYNILLSSHVEITQVVDMFHCNSHECTSFFLSLDGNELHVRFNIIDIVKMLQF